MAYLQLSARLKQLRTEKELTQAQAARRVCVTRSTLSAYENGTRYPSYDVLVSLSYLFGVSTDYLLCKEERRFLDVSGLNEQEVAAIANMVSLLRSKNEKSCCPMKKSKSLISLLLLLSLLLFTFSLTAYAAEEEPVTDETPMPEQTVAPAPVEVTSLEELMSAIEAAEDGDTIYISKKIWINGETLIADKEIILKPSDSLTSEMIYVTQQGGTIQGFHFSENEKRRNTITVASGNNTENVLVIKDCVFDGNSIHSGSFLCNFAYLNIQLYNCSFINNMDFAVSLRGSNDIVDGCIFKIICPFLVVQLLQAGVIYKSAILQSQIIPLAYTTQEQ